MTNATTQHDVAQAGELVDLLLGEITGAQVVAEVTATADGVPVRYQVTGARFEPTTEHPRGRVVLTLSDCVHYSDPVQGCGALDLR